MLGVLKDIIIIKDDVTLSALNFLLHYFYEYSLKWERYVKFHFQQKQGSSVSIGPRRPGNCSLDWEHV